VYEPSGDDVVMLVKRLVSSSCLSQKPVVVMPKDLISRLDVEQLQVLARNKLPARAVKEWLSMFHYTFTYLLLASSQ
jgi:hypothetical protein